MVQSITYKSRPASDDPRVFALIGYAIIIFTFFVLGGWAAWAPLSGAVSAPGFVNTEGNKKTVQHLEGGIVKEILVHEGDHVTAGEILIRLDETQPKGNLEIARNQLYGALARDARLDSELAGSADVAFPAELLAVADDPIAAKAMEDERNQFHDKRAVLDGQISIYHSRGEQLRQEMEGLDRQRAAAEDQIKYIKDELEGVRGLYEKSLVPKTRWLALERERARLEGEIGRNIAERAKAEKSLGETELQIQQVKQQAQEQWSHDLVETREKMRDLRSKYIVAQDVLRRLEITAPVTGRVQNLKVFTIGAVIRQGEPLMDIGPDQDKLIVQARVSTLDIEGVSVGKTAEVRFPAFHDRSLLMIAGTIISISQDRLIDEATKQPYYLALIDVPEENIPPHYRGKLTSGMNADVIMPTKERTALDYLIEPLRNRMRKAFREL
jgi:HlyD family type I secretion membrane fusion protein